MIFFLGFLDFRKATLEAEAGVVFFCGFWWLYSSIQIPRSRLQRQLPLLRLSQQLACGLGRRRRR